MKGKALEFGARWLLGGILRDVAEGKKGRHVYAAYWWLKGRKTIAGFVLAIIAGALAAFTPAEFAAIAPYAAIAGGVVINAGLLDKTWHNSEPPAWASEALHSIVAAGPVLAALVAGLGRVLPNGWGDTLDLWCLAAAEATAFLAAKLAPPPFGER